MINGISSVHTPLSPPVGSRDPGVGRRSVDAGQENQTPGSGLSAEELRVIAALSATDRQVRTHELAHMAVGAGLTGGASFIYQVGPDNQRYAVGGEVSIDISPGSDPEETIARAVQIRAAALAPADPSPQDRKVAALAAQMERAARQELATADSAEGRPQIDTRPSAAAAAYQTVAEGPRASGFSATA